MVSTYPWSFGFLNLLMNWGMYMKEGWTGARELDSNSVVVRVLVKSKWYISGDSQYKKVFDTRA